MADHLDVASPIPGGPGGKFGRASCNFSDSQESRSSDERTSFSASSFDEKDLKGLTQDPRGHYNDDDWDVDPANARNWSSGRKWVAVSIVSIYSLITSLATSMMAPGLPQLAEQYGITNPSVIALSLSIFLATFAIGPLVLSPLSELYGRTWVLHASNLLGMTFTLGCAFAPNIGSFLALRLLGGFWAGAPLAVGSGSIGDLFDAKERASAMALFTLGPLFGPAIGPAASGFMVQNVGLKWVFVLIAGLSAITAPFGLYFLQETYAPVIRMTKARRSMDPVGAMAKVTSNIGRPSVSGGQLIWLNMTRPIALLFGNAIIFMLSLYAAFTAGIFYIMFATFPRLYRDTYGFKLGPAGLSYLGIALGFFIGTFSGARAAGLLYQKLSLRNGGKGTPEMRLPLLFVSSAIIPIGLLWYGWSAHYGIHWIMPIIGTGIFGIGSIIAYLSIQLYLVDAFKYAASAVGAVAFLRSMLGFAFPLFGQQMSDTLSIGPANSLLAGVATLLGVPFPVWLYYKGAAIRERSNVAR